MSNHSKNKSLALLDFDGTITTKDSFVDFLWFSVKKRKFLWEFLLMSPFLVLYLLRIYPNTKMKEKALTRFFKGLEIDKFGELCFAYERDKLPRIIRPEAQERIDWHKKNNHDVAIVTASIENYLINWCDRQKIKLIATKLGIVDNKITGKLKGKLCYGEEKVARIKKKYSLENYSTVYAYGDSRGDLPMFELAQIKYFKWKKIS